jgi:anaerobic dimethyl sulfoxide reductase subunit B (iron-sulfur subunit)
MEQTRGPAPSGGSVTRRTFVGVAAASAVALAAGTMAGRAYGGDDTSGDDTSANQHVMAFWVKASKCVNCGSCVEACRTYHGTADDEPSRRKVVGYTTSSGREVYVSTSCMHCDEPSCVEVCPAKAITKRSDGIVSVDPDRCIGCKYCNEACPFNVPHYTSHGMDKCDFCLSIGVRPGSTPRCVQACPTGALNAGWRDDVMAESGGEVVRIEGSTGPSMYLS